MYAPLSSVKSTRVTLARAPGAGRRLQHDSMMNPNRKGRWLFCSWGSPLDTKVQSAGQLHFQSGSITLVKKRESENLKGRGSRLRRGSIARAGSSGALGAAIDAPSQVPQGPQRPYLIVAAWDRPVKITVPDYCKHDVFT